MSRAGFKKEFVSSAILPDWWDEESCANDPSLFQDIEIRVARFLGLPLAAVTDAGVALTLPAYPQAQLRHVRDVDRGRLGPTIHAAIRIAAAIVRSLRVPLPRISVPPADGLAWRGQIQRGDATVTLNAIAADLWMRGIPVVPLDVLPVPSFQGVACIVEGRPVVLLGHKYDEPGRVAFLVAHEAGHVAAGDCAPDQPVVDEEEEISDDADIERRADQFARRVLIGSDSVPAIDGADFKALASRAETIERETGAEASAVIFAWARHTGDYAKATMAVKALYRGTGARRQLRQLFDRHVDLVAATESDRALLRCVYGDPERDEGPY
jgi:hypothetical protein